MKRIPLVTLLVLVLAMVVAGCGVLSQKTEPTSSVPPVKEVKMVHPSGIPVLMYHKVGDDKDNDAVIREDLFREQMKFLKDNGYNPLTMEQLYEYVVNGAAVPEKPVVLTFDDGYADTYSIVYPIMKEYGFPATVFINPGDIGTRLTWDQVREMHKNGITIANHGFQHIDKKCRSAIFLLTETAHSSKLIVTRCYMMLYHKSRRSDNEQNIDC